MQTVHRRGGPEGGAGPRGWGGASPGGAGIWGRVGGRMSGAGESSGRRPSVRGIGGAPWRLQTARVCPGAHPHAPQGRAPGGTRPRCVRRSGVASRERSGSGQGSQQGRRVGPSGAWGLTSDGVNPLRLEGRSVRGRQRMRARVLGLFRLRRAAPSSSPPTVGAPPHPPAPPSSAEAVLGGLRCSPVRVPEPILGPLPPAAPTPLQRVCRGLPALPPAGRGLRVTGPRVLPPALLPASRGRWAGLSRRLRFSSAAHTALPLASLTPRGPRVVTPSSPAPLQHGSPAEHTRHRPCTPVPAPPGSGWGAVPPGWGWLGWLSSGLAS